MRRVKSVMFAGSVLLLVAGIGGCLFLLLQHEPSFYRLAEISPGKERVDLSMKFLGQCTKLVGCLMEPSNEPWKVPFSQAQINSYLAEDFVKVGKDAESLKKQGITEPRVYLDEDRMRLAFRYGNDNMSTLVSIDLRVWLAPNPNDVNVFAVEILGRRLGALPISSQSILNEITEFARKHNLDVSWYRYNGNPVALVRVQSGRPRPSFRFQRVEVHAGMLQLEGVSLEPLPPNAAQKKALTPLGN